MNHVRGEGAFHECCQQASTLAQCSTMWLKGEHVVMDYSSNKHLYANEEVLKSFCNIFFGEAAVCLPGVGR